MSKAKTLGFAPDRLARIDRLLADDYVASGRLPGAHFLLTRRGEVVHETVVGWRDVEAAAPLTADTVHRIYSMTKPITCVALMTLVEEGRIALDDPVARHIPSWRDLAVFQSGEHPDFATTPPKRPMEVVDLMRHTAGLTYSFQNLTPVDAAYRKLQILDPYGERDLEGMVAALAHIPLDFSPGEAWNYSVATDVVGYLVQKVAGKPLETVLHERIFEPLKMVDTGFWVRPDQWDRFAACYQATPAGGLELQDGAADSPFLAPPRLYGGGGGLVSTAADYSRFAQMLLNRGELEGARILAPKTVALMSANHLPGGGDMAGLTRSMFSESVNAGAGFGLGMAVVIDPAKTLIPCSPGEIYWGGVASTAFWVDPLEEVTAVLMTQLMPSSAYPIRRELRTLVYSALMDPNA